jgi:hypothetical protein
MLISSSLPFSPRSLLRLEFAFHALASTRSAFPYCHHYLPSSVFPALFFGRLFVALLTNRKSFLFSQSFLETQSMCVVLSSPFLKKLGGRESRGLQTSWGFGWLLHIFLLLSSRFVSPVGVFLSNNFFKNCSFIGEIVIRKWGHLQMELLSVL